MASTPSNTVNLIPEKVQEGKLIAALSLEERVLANGVLPNASLPERASLVNGIIYGLLEQGQWNEAIRLVYKDGSPARALFDGNWDGLRRGILASVQLPSRRPYIGDNVAELLLQHNEAELLYDIACILPLQTQELEEVLNLVESKIPAERMREGNNLIAASAEQDKRYDQAYTHYQKAQNTNAIENLYQRLLRDSDPELPTYQIAVLLTIAEETTTKDNSRAAETVYALLDKPEVVRSSREIPLRLMGMVREHKITLSTSQDDLLKDALVSRLALYELREIKHDDENLPLRWAKAHARDHPQDAYAVFKSRKYQGPEINAAVQQGLKNREEKHDHYQGLAPQDIDEPHLRQAYDSSSLELKVSIASHLEDNNLLQDLSRQYSRQKEKSSIEHAYRLWIYGHGDQDDPYVEKLRESMIQKELVREYGPSAGLFEFQDAVGNKIWFTHLIEKNPAVAYDVAQQIQDKSLLQQAREKMVAQSPLEALRKFQSHRQEDIDAVGVNLALDALATQYRVSREKIDGYLALKR